MLAEAQLEGMGEIAVILQADNLKAGLHFQQSNGYKTKSNSVATWIHGAVNVRAVKVSNRNHMYLLGRRRCVVLNSLRYGLT